MSKNLLRKNFSTKILSFSNSFEYWWSKDNWVETLRSFLGMTLKQLGQRLNVSAVSVKQVSDKEKKGEVTLKKMQEYARALECEFVYAFIPNKDLDEIINDQARKKAIEVLKEASLHMEIEDQEVGDDMKSAQLEELIERFKNSRSLWD